ncbi:MAG: Type 1 glutamine amidotransferase-like domain-containing protein [Kribbellaceae bacterium]
MRLYLSSFRLGDHPERLVAMVEPPGRTAVVCNAIDTEPADVRAEMVAAELDWLTELGLRPEELDLRTDDPARLASFDAMWVRGGNVFVLRDALRRSGADQVVVDLLGKDALVYAGYSAGPCVLAPSLRGLEICDDVSLVAEPIWDGLGVLDHAIVPHLDSPGHPETELVERVAALYETIDVPYQPLSDGQVLVIDGESRQLV